MVYNETFIYTHSVFYILILINIIFTIIVELVMSNNLCGVQKVAEKVIMRDYYKYVVSLRESFNVISQLHLAIQ